MNFLEPLTGLKTCVLSASALKALTMFSASPVQPINPPRLSTEAIGTGGGNPGGA